MTTLSLSRMAMILLVAGSMDLQAQYVPDNIVYFGDSFLDVGNVGPIHTNTAAESGMGVGGNFAQQLSGKFGYTVTASSLGGNDYAQSGATTATGTYNSASQVSSYLAANGGQSSGTTLYVFNAVANDIFTTANASNYATVGKTAADNIESQIVTLANAGGGTFLWLNMFPTNLTPNFAGNTVDQDATLAFNSEWSADLASLRSAYPSLHFVGFDFYTVGTQIIDNASTYGFTDTTDGWTTAPSTVPFSEASSDPDADKFVSFDGEHPTTHMNGILATKTYIALETTPEPSTDALLLAGLALLGFRARRKLA